jgi:hypothetical protein
MIINYSNRGVNLPKINIYKLMVDFTFKCFASGELCDYIETKGNVSVNTNNTGKSTLTYVSKTQAASEL